MRFQQANGLNDPFLDSFQHREKNLILSAFGESVRNNEYGKRSLSILRSGTVKAAISDIRTTFRSHFRDDPGVDPDGQPNIGIRRQTDGYTNEDPAEKHKKALPVRVFKYLNEKHQCHFDEAIGQLTTTAFFFAMRSCEYSEVKIPGKTKLLRLSDLQFFKNKKTLNIEKDDIENEADCVSITFRNQKNGKKNAIVSQYRNSFKLCSVKALAKLAKRILGYKGTDINSYVNTIMINNILFKIKNDDVIKRLRQVVRIFGKDDLGFNEMEIGTHSIRSSTAMQLHINKIPTYTIMLLGRWSCDAFMRYIRSQVQEFSSGLSEVMVQKEFFTVPEVEQVTEDDPQTRNTASFATASSFGGRAMGARYPQPAVHTWF